MNPGNSSIDGLAFYPGSPSGVSTAILNSTLGELIIDYSTPALYQRTSATVNTVVKFLTDASGQALTLPTITNGLLASGSVANNFAGSTGTFLTSTGLTTISGALKGSTQALSGPGAVNVTTVTTKVTTTGVADALTLADGTDGQFKTVIHDVDGGSAVLTPTTKTGFSTITFTNAGESATLQFVTTRGWILIAIVGAVAA
jgi:hypothetical protein